MLSRLLLKLRIEALALLVGGFTVAFLTSCAHVPDVPICVEINSTKGFCTDTISDVDYDIDEQHPVAFEGEEKPLTWWQRRPFMILVPASSWKALKTYIIQQCKRSNCDQYVQSWDRKLNELNPGGVP